VGGSKHGVGYVEPLKSSTSTSSGSSSQGSQINSSCRPQVILIDCAINRLHC
jgi:hypothetical protein